MTDYSKLQSRCQRGEASLAGANNLLAECYGALGKLMDENERLTKQWGDRPAYRTPEYESKRDAMWRRAHMVATSKGYDHINMAIAAAPKACTDCMGCGGEWQGEGEPNSVCETCRGSRGKVLEEELCKLKAENEQLRKSLTYIRDTSDDWHVCEKAADALSDASKGNGEQP